MKKLIIKQKESGTRSIYDLANQHYDREIDMPSGTLYAIVCPSYFNLRAKTAKNAKRAFYYYKKLNKANYYPEIIDIEGNYIDAYDDGFGEIILKVDINKETIEIVE